MTRFTPFTVDMGWRVREDGDIDAYDGFFTLEEFAAAGRIEGVQLDMARKVKETWMTGANDDGVALQSTPHPVEITDGMVDAGVGVAWASGDLQGNANAAALVRAVFTAMVHAAPEPDLDLELNEAALERAIVDIEAYKDSVERFALRLALGRDRAEWPPHYPDDRKEYWRQFVRDLSNELAAARIEDAHGQERTGPNT